MTDIAKLIEESLNCKRGVLICPVAMWADRAKIALTASARPVVTAENARVELNKRAWELIDLLAVFFGDSIDQRTWDHLLVYAPKKDR